MYNAPGRAAAGRYVIGSLSVAAWAAAALSATRALAILGLVDLECAAVEIGAIQCLHGTGCIGIGHLHEPEAARASRLTVRDQGDLLDGSVLGKQGAHTLIGSGEGQITNVKFCHCEILGEKLEK